VVVAAVAMAVVVVVAHPTGLTTVIMDPAIRLTTINLFLVQKQEFFFVKKMNSGYLKKSATDRYNIGCIYND
jgi:hypothetical protein